MIEECKTENWINILKISFIPQEEEQKEEDLRQAYKWFILKIFQTLWKNRERVSNIKLTIKKFIQDCFKLILNQKVKKIDIEQEIFACSIYLHFDLNLNNLWKLSPKEGWKMFGHP